MVHIVSQMFSCGSALILPLPVQQSTVNITKSESCSVYFLSFKKKNLIRQLVRT